jgi:pectinesterase
MHSLCYKSSVKKITQASPFSFSSLIAHMMALANFLFILFLLPSLEALSNVIPSEEQELNTQALILQACSNVENLSSCLSNFQAELQKSGPPTAQSIIHAALRATLDEARRAIDTITKFNSLSISYREQVAIEDCKELLDFSVSELAWSLMEMNKIRAGIKNVHYEGNLKAWLSAALSNPDTCLEGFEGTDRHLENFISGSIKQVTQLIGNVLGLYTQLHSLRTL